MRAIAAVLLIMCVMLVTGCRTMQVVGHEDWSGIRTHVNPGDTVEVVKRDGRVETFVVTEVTPDALVGAQVRVAREDISRLQVNAVHKGRTFGAAFGSAGAVLIILIGAATAAVLGGG